MQEKITRINEDNTEHIRFNAKPTNHYPQNKCLNLSKK